MPKGRNGITPSNPPKSTKPASADTEALDIPVQFGGVSLGDETANITLVIDRTKLNLKRAEHFFCGSRLEVTLAADPNADKDSEDQNKFWDDVDTINAVVDSKSLRITPKRFGVGLTFQLTEIDVAEIAHLAKHVGRIKCTRTGAMQSKKERAKTAAAEATEDMSEPALI